MILAFSSLFGELTAIVLSRMKPIGDKHAAIPFIQTYIPSSRYESVNFPPAFLMIWMCSKSVDPLGYSMRCWVMSYYKNAYLQPKNCVDCEVREVILVLRQHF